VYDSLMKAATSLGSPRVLVVGDYMLDVYIYGDAQRISPEAPVPVLRIKDTRHSCGGAASVAMDVAALGARPVCLGVVGDDKNGHVLTDLLAQAGADAQGLLVAGDRPTTTKTRLVGLAQHRHQQQLFRMDDESCAPLPEPVAARLLDLYEHQLEAAQAVCLQDYNKGLLTPALCRRMIDLARKAGKPVLVDPALGADYVAKYDRATLITPNRQETATAVGFEIACAEDYARAADKLFGDLHLDAAVITLDKEGAYLKTGQVSQVVPTRPRQVYDVTGAGDEVLAMLAVALAAGCDYPTSVQLANIAGGIEVEKFGVATVSIEEIVRDILGQTRGKGSKVRPLDSLLAELEGHRRQKAAIVFTNGCFDVLHRGHVEYLRFCKQQGEVVVVGLNSDASVRQIKGPSRPINNQDDRAAVLAALESVDYVAFFDEPDPLALIKKVRPDVLVKGQDWQDKGVIGADVVQSYGGKVVLAPLVEGKSSTSTINKMQSLGVKC
jgi:D-beta-D-heptose 7-phosphate kinase/D-beta-D-heptose 1-phosphate adenosyltransferase